MIVNVVEGVNVRGSSVVVLSGVVVFVVVVVVVVVVPPGQIEKSEIGLPGFAHMAKHWLR